MARSNSRWPPWAAGRSASCGPSTSTRRLPAHRSPWSRAGGSPVVEAIRAIRRGAPSASIVSVGQRARRPRASRASGSSRHVGVELRPRRRAGRSAGRDCRWSGGPRGRSTGLRRRGARPAPRRVERRSTPPGRPSSIHSRTRNAGAVGGAVGDGDDARHRDGVGVAQPRQAGRLGGEEAGRRRRMGLREQPCGRRRARRGTPPRRRRRGPPSSARHAGRQRPRRPSAATPSGR